MKHLKGFFLVLTGLAIIITVVSLLMPGRIMIVRSVVIHANAKTVYSEIADLNKWKDWHPVFMTGAVKVNTVLPSQKATASWSINGKENTLLLKSMDSMRIAGIITRRNENDVINIFTLNYLHDSAATQVEWRVITDLKWYPWEKFYGIFIDKISGPGYTTALNNLKDFLEADHHFSQEN